MEQNMDLMKLQQVLGEQILRVSDKNLSYEERKQEAELAQTVSSLAKQYINGADVILRTEKLISEGKLQNSNAGKLIGRKQDA